MSETLKAVHISIAGRVQGVGYRAWMARQAGMAGLSGWVRNRRTGEVEAIVCGPADKVAAMIEAARGGPYGARVSEIRDLGPAAPLQGAFEVLPTV